MADGSEIFDMKELRRQLDELEDDPNPEDFSFMDYLAGSDPQTLRERAEKEARTPGEMVGGLAIREERIKEAMEEDSWDNDLLYAEITDEDIKKAAPKYYPRERVYRSLLLEVFTVDQCIEFERLARTLSIDNERKIEIIKEKLTEWGKSYQPLGGGTNRWGGMVDGYVIKVACDTDGKIDNRREFIYSMQLQPYVIKCYECYSDGLITVFEYVEAFTIDDFWKHQDDMRKILKKISENFLIGDVGVSSDNYVNWGFREDGSCVILDFAYIYSVKFKKFECSCSPGAYLAYDKDFNNLICSYCGKKYSFKQIRKKITMSEQLAEIGDLREKGYILSSQEEVKELEPKFVMGAADFLTNKIRKDRKKKGVLRKSHDKKRNHSDNIMSTEEVVNAIYDGRYDSEFETDQV